MTDSKKKKKRTVLMSMEPSEVTPLSASARVEKVARAVKKNVRARGIGFGGDINELDRTGKLPVKMDWKVGFFRGTGKGFSKRFRGHRKAGFRFRVKF